MKNSIRAAYLFVASAAYLIIFYLIPQNDIERVMQIENKAAIPVLIESLSQNNEYILTGILLIALGFVIVVLLTMNMKSAAYKK